MANTRVSDLTSGGAFAATDLFYVVETAGVGGVKKTGAQLQEFQRDTIASFATAGTNMSIVHDDGADTLTFNNTQAAYTDADAVGAISDELGGNGLAVRTAADTLTPRSLTQPAAGITISNNDGVSGNPTFALADDLSALEGLGSTGIAVRTAANTWAQRTIAGGTGITVSDGNGVSGNPSVAVTAGGIDTAQLANDAVTFAKLQELSADVLIGASSAGNPVEISCTSAGRNLIDDADAAAQRATLGISTSATTLLNTGIAFSTGIVSDDAAAEVNVGGFNGATVIIQGNVTAAGMGLFFLRTNSTVSAEEVAQIGTTINVVAGDGSLGGTTGPDNKTNIRPDSSGSSLWIENRTGAARGYTVYLLRQ